MLPSSIRRFALLCALFSVAGCSSARDLFVPTPVVERVKVRLAADLFDCGQEPLAPLDTPEVDELTFGRWVADLQAWGQRCRDRLLDAGRANAEP